MKGGAWGWKEGEDGYDIEVDGQGNPNKVNDLVHQHKCRVHLKPPVSDCSTHQSLTYKISEQLWSTISLTEYLLRGQQYVLIVSN